MSLLIWIDAVSQALTILLCHFLFEEIIEKGKIALPLSLGNMDHSIEYFPNPWEFQPGEIGLDPLKHQCIAHIVHPTAWS